MYVARAEIADLLSARATGRGTKDDDMKIKIEVEVTDSRLAHLLCCAIEGGIGYWAQIVDYVKPTSVWKGPDWDQEVFKHIHWPMSPGGAVVFQALDESERLVLDREALERGLRLMAEKEPEHFARFMAENEDADTGDVLVQLALLGEVVYG